MEDLAIFIMLQQSYFCNLLLHSKKKKSSDSLAQSPHGHFQAAFIYFGSMCEQNLWTLQQKPDCIFLTMRILYQLLGALEIWATFCPYPHPHHKGKNGIFTYSHSTQIRDNIPCCAAVSYWYSCIVKKEPAETNRD